MIQPFTFFFFSELFEVYECIIYDASLCLVTMNANGLLEAEAYPLRSTSLKSSLKL